MIVYWEDKKFEALSELHAAQKFEAKIKKWTKELLL
jgi:hypothetical protein